MQICYMQLEITKFELCIFICYKKMVSVMKMGHVLLAENCKFFILPS